ncbi:MAG: hypothetical protein DCF25_15775 [Leptolyngbya foveolarum]|uniref:Uncharacterized protein n=1 Tax=Leptolyngbya foveolarum TaxID=47253 RepID=A0A2W4U3S5_9CYAN|nr:MAG: hypothetical protein DCF25_15775 [Leptolyngbya foveolarum]
MKSLNSGGKWIPPLPKGKVAVVYGLKGEQITVSAQDYDLMESIVFQSLPLVQMTDSLKALKASLPGPESGLQIIPVRMGDEGTAVVLDGLVLYGLKQTVPEGKSGVEHSVIRILLDPASANSDYAKTLEDRRNLGDCQGADGLMLAAIMWEIYSLESYKELIDWNSTIPKAHRDFFTTDGWVSCAVQLEP